MIEDKGPSAARRLINLFPEVIRDRFDANQIKAMNLLDKSAEFEKSNMNVAAFNNVLDAAEVARVNSGVQNDAMQRLERLTPKLGEQSLDTMGPLEAGMAEQRVRALKQQRMPKP